MLAASAAAYGVQTDGSLVRRQPSYDRVGFIGNPVAISSGPDDIDAALVGLNTDGIIIAFRGTLPPRPPITTPVVLDWIQDMISVPSTFIGFPGKVHTGFFAAITSLWPGILKAVQDAKRDHPEAQIYVTGHSKGGSLASLGAWLLRSQSLSPSAIVTFAAAHVGDAGFAAAYNEVFGDQLRFENYLDIVPFMPPESAFFDLLSEIPEIGRLFVDGENWDYTPVGKLQYIRKDGVVEGNSFGLGFLRATEIAGQFLSNDFSAVAKAHALVGYSLGYCRAVCPSTFCDSAPSIQ
jgi:hypothetical protein